MYDLLNVIVCGTVLESKTHDNILISHRVHLSINTLSSEYWDFHTRSGEQ